MPILQNAKHVYISSSDFRDINGNYYDYGNSAGANRGPTSVPTEHMRVAGQIRTAQTTMSSGPGGRQTIQNADPVYLESIWGSMNGLGSTGDANVGPEFMNTVFGAMNGNPNNARQVEAVFNNVFSSQNGRTANAPPQTQTRGNSLYTGDAGNNNNMSSPTPTQTRQNPPAVRPNGSGPSLEERILEWQAAGGNAANVSPQASSSPRPNVPGTPSFPFPTTADARTNTRDNSTFTLPSAFTGSGSSMNTSRAGGPADARTNTRGDSSWTVPSSFTGTGSRMNMSWPPTSPAAGPNNGQGQLNFQYPDPNNTVSSPSVSFQYVNIPNMTVQPSPFPNNGNSPAQFFQSPTQSFQISNNTDSNGNSAGATNGSILERPISLSPLHDDAMLPQQDNASPAADAPPPEAAVNEALTKTPLERRAGFLGF